MTLTATRSVRREAPTAEHGIRAVEPGVAERPIAETCVGTVSGVVGRFLTTTKPEAALVLPQFAQNH